MRKKQLKEKRIEVGKRIRNCLQVGFIGYQTTEEIVAQAQKSELKVRAENQNKYVEVNGELKNKM